MGMPNRKCLVNRVTNWYNHMNRKILTGQPGQSKFNFIRPTLFSVAIGERAGGKRNPWFMRVSYKYMYVLLVTIRE